MSPISLENRVPASLNARRPSPTSVRSRERSGGERDESAGDRSASRRRRRRVRDPSDSEDIRKVEEFLAGDAQGFEFLFEKYRERVHALAYRFVRNQDDALEITQEVFLRVYQSLESFKTDSRFFTWLYRITVNRSIDFTRSRKIQPIVGLDGLDAALPRPDDRRRPEPGPLERAQASELEGRLADAVTRLSEKHRAVFVLHASQNLSYKEIAEVVDCNVGTVMSRLFYARRKLQETLSSFGFDLSGSPQRKGKPPAVR